MAGERVVEYAALFLGCLLAWLVIELDSEKAAIVATTGLLFWFIARSARSGKDGADAE